MPEAFNACIDKGGRVRTKKLGGGKYMHICFLDGKSYAGHVKQNKKGKTIATRWLLYQEKREEN